MTVPVNIVEPSLSDAMSWTYVPKVVDIKAGDSVVWRNLGTLEHTVTADSGDFDTGLLSAGTTFERKFDRPGAYAYHCTPHPWMKGVVRVTSAEGEEPPPLPEVGTPMVPGEHAAALPPSRAQGGGVGTYPASNLGSNRTFLVALLVAAAILAATWFGASIAARPRTETTR